MAILNPEGKQIPVKIANNGNGTFTVCNPSNSSSQTSSDDHFSPDQVEYTPALEGEFEVGVKLYKKHVPINLAQMR